MSYCFGCQKFFVSVLIFHGDECFCFHTAYASKEAATVNARMIYYALKRESTSIYVKVKNRKDETVFKIDEDTERSSND